MSKYLIQTFGCQMNVHDSRRMEEVLSQAGYEAAQTASDADVIVFNTCSIREKAEHKLMSALGTYRPLKHMRPDLVLAVAGCVAQQESEKLLRKVPYLDVVLGPDNIPELPALIEHVRSGGPPVARTVFDNDNPSFLQATPRAARDEVCSFVTIMKGCDQRCSFCIVPYTRGSERYRSADDIIHEIKHMVEGGIREVTLLGQTVNSWYEPGTADINSMLAPHQRALDKSSQFASLLQRISDEVPALSRLRYTSPHPQHLTDELLEKHASLEVLASHVHLPVQSGSNRVLKRMIRRYTREHYIERAKALLQSRKGMTLSTDVIVGFPGESDEDFEQTLDLIKSVGFVSAFAFKYSPRPFTPSLKLEDDVSEEVKDERLAALLSLVAEQQDAHLESLVGTIQSVLIEGPSRGVQGRFMGRTERNEIVHVDLAPEQNPVGQLLEVEICQAFKHSLRAVKRGESLAPVPAKNTRRLPLAGVQ
ncbi:MAG: tRNA (N6-isopentenyl adenosine(37)-C2)-methylthiotransferase MiaB [Myxococcales bacterium]|nr:MAG: tRNA (N6-isopentenyl adenosine(37)-C2)-methylthiotransferase MiaB [Myxococcales bacterium]